MSPESRKDVRKRLEAAVEGSYRIKKELGQGGMAIVYLAKDLRHDRKVAIKLIPPETVTPSLAERFSREIQFTAKLQHPHILPLIDSSTTGDLLYYVMPNVAGESLRDRLNEKTPIPVDEAVKITGQLASALQYAHDSGVIHRDIKPENVLLSSGLAVLADFGIAKAVADPSDGMTVVGLTLGTPVYMSPEQAAGGDVEAQADQYSLASVLYEMLAGRPPFVAESIAALLELKLAGQAPALSSFRDDLPPGLDAVMNRALAVRPRDRYSDVAEFAEALNRVFPTTTAASAAHPVARATRPRRSPAAWGARVLVAGGVVSIGVLIFLLLTPPPRAATGRVMADSLAADAEDSDSLSGDSVAPGVISPGPFAVDSADSTAMVVAEGFTEELARQLGSGPPAGGLDSAAGVVLRGGIGRAGEDLALTLRLIRTSDRAMLWKETYVFPPGDPAAIRVAAIGKAGRALGARIGAVLAGDSVIGLAK